MSISNDTSKPSNDGIRKIWFDTDSGTDDMTAFLIIHEAIKQSNKQSAESTNNRWELAAISTVFGNVTLKQATENVLICCDVLDIDQAQSTNQSTKQLIPVYEGCSHSMMYEKPINTWEGHGENGLGGADFGRTVDRSVDGKSSDKPCRHLTKRLQSKHASSALIDYVTAHPNEVDLIAVGPLTNIALAIKLCPELPKLVRSMCVMGGTIYGKGNVTMNAEFNFWCDPESAHIVLNAWDRVDIEPILIMPVEPTEEFAFTWHEFEKMTRFPTIESDFLKRIYTACRKWSSAFIPRPINQSNNQSNNQSITTPDREAALQDMTVSFQSQDELAFPHSARHLMQPCDAYAVACLLDPSVAQSSSTLYAQVVLEGEHTRGGVIYDWHYFSSNRRDSKIAAHHALSEPKHFCNVKVVRHIDRKRMYQMLEDACRARTTDSK